MKVHVFSVRQRALRITILIPCHNEEKSIRMCLMSCIHQTRPADEIIIVNDGSTDQTAAILRKFRKKVKIIQLAKASGNKSFAQEIGLKAVTGDIFISTDADTRLDRHFVEEVEKSFQDPQVAAMGGYVRSLPYNWLTACRAYDYVIGQNIHKLAQSKLDFILVIPGAAGAFRTEIFRQIIGFDHDTLTEDLDFTYKLHRHGLKIAYNRQAIVYTQDPANLHSYINQMRRWYAGGWQNLLKHLKHDLLLDPRRSLELSLMYVEGVIFSLVLLLIPLFNFILAMKLLLVLLILIILQAIYSAIVEKRADLLLVPLFYWLLMFIHSEVFLEQFIKEILLKRQNLTWFQPERVKV